MNELEIFKNEEFGEIRTVVIENEPWFVGRDVATALGYAKPENAIATHVEKEDKYTTTLKQGNGTNLTSKTTLINESGIYSLIFGSKLESAKRFNHWVTSEVLPTIRKHGAYMTDEKAFDVLHNAGGLADLLQQAAEQLKQKDIQIEIMKPKALFADAVASSKNSILIGELAKLIKANGYDIGQNKLFSWMRENGYLMKSGEAYNQPTQKKHGTGTYEDKEVYHQ